MRTYMKNVMHQWRQRLEWSVYKPGNANNHWKLGEGPGEETPSEPSERTHAAEVVWDFQAPQLRDSKFPF